MTGLKMKTDTKGQSTERGKFASNTIAVVTEPKAQDERKGAHWRGAVVGILALTAIGLTIRSGIRSRAQAETSLVQTTKAAAVPTVAVVYPKVGSASEEISLPGNAQPYIDAPIYARTSGYLKKWYYDIGAHVRKGALLAVIETPELDAQLQQAQADLMTAQANLQLARVTAARYQHPLLTNSVSRQSTDEAVSGLAARQATVAASQANVMRLEQLQDYERVYAPFDGVITQRNTDIGDLIQAGQNSASRDLFDLAQVSTLRVYIAVPEAYADLVTTGEKATLTSDEYPDRMFAGKVVRNSDAIDPATRTLKVEVDVNNASGKLQTGAYVFVRLTVPPVRGAVTIPATTLLFRTPGLRAAVVRNGRVELVPITIGHDYGNSVEVVSGLNPQDAVIVNPADSLASGQAVRIGNGAGI